MNVKVRKALVRYGRETMKLENPDPRDVMTKLYVDLGWSLKEIAGVLSTVEGVMLTRPAIGYQIKKMGIPMAQKGRPQSLAYRVHRKGYGSVREYFLKNALKTFTAMAAELGVATGVVHKYYDRFVVESGL